jgi:L-aspartate oxidase
MKYRENTAVQTDNIIVVGSGVAGLVCALALAPRRVTLITKTNGLAGGSSVLAKGGIAVAVGPDDSASDHAMDTLHAGAGLSDPEKALELAEDGIESLRLLVEKGVPFDRAPDGTLELAREAAHTRARVVHARGDSTGEVLIAALARMVRATPSIHVLENTFVYDLVVNDGRVDGLITIDPDNGCIFRQSSRVVLATGGIGMIWWQTTNPLESTGDGLAMAARAGAKLTDLEFMQFHPTALAVTAAGARLPLLTEALRGAGAVLLDQSGRRFMIAEHEDAELAPRDVVARAIQKRTSSGQAVFLDLRPVIDSGKARLFPQALDTARNAGLDPASQPLPVAPAAHYHMGGVQVDRDGRTSINGLWACGEVATTGIHGANRLASNSLLEGLVYARKVARNVCGQSVRKREGAHCKPDLPQSISMPTSVELKVVLETVRHSMSEFVGISRSANGLESALSALVDLELQLQTANSGPAPTDFAMHETFVRYCEVRNVVLVARLVTFAALQREESRGAHYRDDFPSVRTTWERHQEMTINSLNASQQTAVFHAAVS